jgi:threonylcarbamoyladenosine tRNA methylthiotransferase MtaB
MRNRHHRLYTKTMQAFAVENFGCRAARADGEAVGDRLRSAGLDERDPTAADVVVVNTCSVTAEADRAARAFIRRTHRRNPAARIVVTGCYAQRAPEELAILPGVAAVVGNSHKALAPQIVLGLVRPLSPQPAGARQSADGLIQIQAAQAAAAPQQVVWVDDRFAHSFLEEARLIPGAQTRPNLKIQEGCGNRCTFCVIPQTRGSSRSLPAAAVLRQIEGFVESGGNELVLSGINLGRWGRDLADTGESASAPRSLAALVRRMLEQTALPRLRLSSIEPMDWDRDLIGLMKEFGGSRLARHAHLPLQSGSDAVLRRMHRRYRPWHYEQKVQALLDAAGPDLALGADVMAGFPGETDHEFAETVDFLRSLPFGYLHLFPFSPRPGTRAWSLHAEHPVPPPVVEERMAQLRALAAEKTQSHRERFFGRELEALTLQTPSALAASGRTLALTENFLPIEIAGKLSANRPLRVRLSSMQADGALHALPATEATPQYAAMAMSV